MIQCELLLLLPGQTVNTIITLEARATIEGTVRDANGDIVPGGTVRIVMKDGYEFVFANDQGEYRFPDRPLGQYLIQAPGPSQEALVVYMIREYINPYDAYTAISPDIPDDLNFEIPGDVPTFSSENEAIEAYANEVETIFNLSESILSDPSEPDLSGGFRWTRVKLFQDSVTIFADINYLRQGTVSGVTRDNGGLATASNVRIISLSVSNSGAAVRKELGRLITDPVTGEFSFSGIVLFDQDTFLNSGIRSGNYTLEAANSFEPGIPTFSEQLSNGNPNQDDVELKFFPVAETRGTVSGLVVMPDDETPAGAGVEVTISFSDGITVTTDKNGRFDSQFPIPKNQPYSVTAHDPVSGLQGRVFALVKVGENVDPRIRLLGLGDVKVIVKRSDGSLVEDANLKLKRVRFPDDELNGVTNADREVLFENVTEGLFSVSAEERVTGLKGRVSGTIIRDTDITAVLVIMESGSVSGSFISADGAQVIPNAQVVLTSGFVHAYGITDQDGRF